jgi:hypothetical protein
MKVKTTTELSRDGLVSIGSLHMARQTSHPCRAATPVDTFHIVEVNIGEQIVLMVAVMYNFLDPLCRCGAPHKICKISVCAALYLNIPYNLSDDLCSFGSSSLGLTPHLRHPPAIVCTSRNLIHQYY